jgi:LuxR family transcriptional regulator, maltose regulon positive regulatory protein
MGQILQIHDAHNIDALDAQRADTNATVRGDGANVIPLFGSQRDVPRATQPTARDSRSALALRSWLVQSLLLEAIMRDEVGDLTAAERALERALGIAADDRVVLPFTVDPVPALLERHARSHTTHADLIVEIFQVLGKCNLVAPSSGSESVPDPLTDGEARVLHYLPTNLSKGEIAQELYVSVHTVKTHMKHIYLKLDAHSRREAVQRAREYGLIGRGHVFGHSSNN